MLQLQCSMTFTRVLEWRVADTAHTRTGGAFRNAFHIVPVLSGVLRGRGFPSVLLRTIFAGVGDDEAELQPDRSPKP